MGAYTQLTHADTPKALRPNSHSENAARIRNACLVAKLATQLDMGFGVSAISRANWSAHFRYARITGTL